MNSIQLAVHPPAVINVEQKAKQVLAALYQLQPQINIRGMEPEVDLLRGMRDDLRELVEELTRDNQRLARVVGSWRTDVISTLRELKKCSYSTESSEMSDEELHKLSLVAELFADRCREYFQSKKQFKAIKNGVNHGA